MDVRIPICEKVRVKGKRAGCGGSGHGAESLGKLLEEGLGVEPEITAHRIGEVPGIHPVTYTSEVDKLTLTHEAFGREGLAAGAVAAALMTEGLEGVHEFKELL